MDNYKVSKTISKTVVPPVVVIGGGKLLQVGSSRIGIDLDDSTCMTISSAIFGVVSGIINIIKNRWRSRTK